MQMVTLEMDVPHTLLSINLILIKTFI